MVVAGGESSIFNQFCCVLRHALGHNVSAVLKSEAIKIAR